MKVVNNIMTDNYNMPLCEFLPDKFIVKNVLQNKLKCDKIQVNNTNSCINVYWIRG